jgi:hypothetical protein
MRRLDGRFAARTSFFAAILAVLVGRADDRRLLDARYGEDGAQVTLPTIATSSEPIQFDLLPESPHRNRERLYASSRVG